MTLKLIPLKRSVDQKGKLRIIAGVWRRHQLSIAPVPGLRPTTDRLREVLFSWLGLSGCEGLCVLDLFSGTGALGLEAASRGAKQVTFVENHPQVCAQLHSNITLLSQKWQPQYGQQPVFTLIRNTAEAVLAQRMGTYDLIFLDPPFGSHHLDACLAKLPTCLKPGGLVYVEWGEPLPTCRSLLAQRFGHHSAEVLKYKRVGGVHAHLVQVSTVDPLSS